jgi:hypothetical protein
MKVFDCHTHIENGFSGYTLQDVVSRNVIFNSVASYREHIRTVAGSDCTSLIFDCRNNVDFVVGEANKGKISALKIHSRIQELTTNDYPLISEKLSLTPATLPVIVDAFYYGDALEFNPSLSAIIMLAKQHSGRPFVIAHCGGYEILKYFFHLRPLHNIYYDLSFSLQYLRDSSLFTDLIKLIRYTDKKKIMWGSDYYLASPEVQLKILLDIFDDLKLGADDRERILYGNAELLFLKSHFSRRAPIE